MFRDRQEAGQMLGIEVARLGLHEPVVLALPRGGVPVAAEVAKALGAPLDLIIVRKVGAPGNPELAVAAIVDGDPPDVVLNREVVEAYSLDDAELGALIQRERPELDRRRLAYRGKRSALSVAGKTAIIIDDGAATGTTMKVAIRALRRRSPREIIVALPVSPPDTVAELSQEADRVVCLSQPGRFLALGYHYRSFPQLMDGEVTAALDEARRRRAAVLRAGRGKASGSDAD
jgi:putative phosphoribosyl transferase